MDFYSLIKTGWISIYSNKTRSFLTTLGIIIGVGTIISMVSIIEGINDYVYKVLGTIGSDVIYLQKYQWSVRMGGLTEEELKELAKRPDITLEDVHAIKNLESVEEVFPLVSLPFTERIIVSRRLKSFETYNIDGSEPGYLSSVGYEILKGRDLTKEDVFYRRKVAILGQDIVEKLFDKNEDPLGDEIMVNGKKFVVIGILKKRGSILGQSLDNYILIPRSTHEALFQPKGVYSVYGGLVCVIKPKKGMMEKAIRDVEGLMRIRRGLRFNEKNNFGINTQEILLEAYKKITQGIFFAMLAIASLALIVGGIGIMNVMIISVKERTKEIGLRMAVGAKRRDILLQFLIEAIILTGVGGIFGVILGLLLAKLVDVMTPLPSSAPMWSVFLGVGFSSLVGLFFGIHPATMASKLDPIEALRYE